MVYCATRSGLFGVEYFVLVSVSTIFKLFIIFAVGTLALTTLKTNPVASMLLLVAFFFVIIVTVVR